MSALREILGNYCREFPIDRVIAELAARQHGVVARRQLAELGVALAGIDYRLKIGRLHRVRQAVYAVGHARLSPDGRRMAAVLACGEDAALSHAGAGALYGIVDSAARYDVTAPRDVRRPGITTHFVVLPADELTTWRGIPVTVVPRTLLDMATVLRPERVRRAVSKAEARGLHDHLSLPELLERHPRHRGGSVIRSILRDLDPGVTRSELEERWLDFLADRGFARPRVNVALQVRGGWIEADCVWYEQRVVAELDGRAFHDGREAWERDRERDSALQAAGWSVIRVTWRRLHRDPDGLAADVAALLEDWPRRRR